MLTDVEIDEIIADFVRAQKSREKLASILSTSSTATAIWVMNFSARIPAKANMAGSFENRTRFLREVVDGIRSNVSGLQIGVRVSIFDTVPFIPDPAQSSKGKPGPGIPENHADLIPYRWGFGVDTSDPTVPDLSEGERFLALLEKMKIFLVNVTAGSPYYNPHIQRPALYPPSDGYQPPEDPLAGVARQMDAHAAIEAEISKPYICGHCVHLFAGLFAARGAGGPERGMGRCHRPGPDGAHLSGNVVGCLHG